MKTDEIMNRLGIEAQKYIKCMFSCVYLCAGGFLLKKHRPLLNTISNHFDHSTGVKPLIPEISIGEILGNDISLKLTEIDAIAGNVVEIELLVIAALVQQTEPHLCFEIGTFDGRTALNIATNQPTDGRVYTLDLPRSGKDSTLLSLDEGEVRYIDKPESGVRFAGHHLADKIKQLYGDSATYDFSPFQNKIDFMFVDGSHSFEYAMSDSLAAIKMVRPMTGMLLWHDYDSPYWPGVTQALNELYKKNTEFSGLRHVRNTSLCILAR